MKYSTTALALLLIACSDTATESTSQAAPDDHQASAVATPKNDAVTNRFDQTPAETADQVRPQPSPRQIALDEGLLAAAGYPCDPEAVRAYLEKGANPNADLSLGNQLRSMEGSEPMEVILNVLNDAGTFTPPEVIPQCREAGRILIEAGANPTRWIHAAVFAHDLVLVRHLLEYGADANHIQDRTTSLPSLGRLIFGFPIAHLMAEYPADPDSVDQYRRQEIEDGNAIFDLLFSRIDMDIFNDSSRNGGSLPLAPLVNRNADVDKLVLWLEAGADPCVRSHDLTIMDLALRGKRLDMVEILENYDCE